VAQSITYQTQSKSVFKTHQYFTCSKKWTRS